MKLCDNEECEPLCNHCQYLGGLSKSFLKSGGVFNSYGEEGLGECLLTGENIDPMDQCENFSCFLVGSGVQNRPVWTFWQELRTGGYKNNSRFSQVLVAAFSLLGITEDDLAHAVDLPVSSVRRWREGKTNPHSLVKQFVYRVLVDVATIAGIEEQSLYEKKEVQTA